MISGMKTPDLIAEIAADIGPHLRDTRQAAELLGLSPRCLEDWRLRGVGPRYIRMSPRAVRYRPRELARWIAEREVASTSDPGPGDGD